MQRYKRVGQLKYIAMIQPWYDKQNSSEDGKDHLKEHRINRVYAKSESEVWEKREVKGDSKVSVLSAGKTFPLARLGWPHGSIGREDQEFTLRWICWESCCIYTRVTREIQATDINSGVRIYRFHIRPQVCMKSWWKWA